MTPRATESTEPTPGGAGREERARVLLERVSARLGDRVLLWRGDRLDGTDVDLLVEDGAAEELAPILADAGLVPRLEPEGHVVWALRSNALPPVDVTRSSEWPGYYPSLAGLRERAVPAGALPRAASPEDRALMLAAEAVHGRPLDKIVRKAGALVAAPGFLRRLEAVARQERFEPLDALIAAPDDLLARARKGRLGYGHALALATRSPAARAAVAARARGRARRLAGDRLPNRGRGAAGRPLLITISGMDGAGKSTAADRIRADLERAGLPVEVAWARLGSEGEMLNRLALPVKRALRREGTVADPVAAGGPTIEKRQRARERSGRRPVLSWIWIAVVAAIHARSYRQAARRRRRGFSLVCDRWMTDALVDLELRYGRHRVAEVVLRRLSPEPDLAVLLEIDAATSIRRKPGDQAERVLREMERLYARSGREAGAVAVDARRPEAEVERELAGLVERARERAAGR